jgi:hypothetical protein
VTRAFPQTNNMQILESDSVAFGSPSIGNERLPLRERMAAAMAVSPFEQTNRARSSSRSRRQSWRLFHIGILSYGIFIGAG